MNVAREKAKAKCKKFSNEEFLTGLGLLLGAAEFSQKGVDLFNVKDDVQDDDDIWQSIRPSPHFEQYMSYSRFKDFRRFLPDIYADDASEEEINPWYQFSPAVEEFNEIRRTKIKCSRWICADESMCAWRPRTTALGGLPNISFVVRKPEPLGTEFKTTACPITGVMRHLEIQRGKEGMKNSQFNAQVGATTGCTLRLLLNTILPPEQQGTKHGIRADAWFGSVRTATEVGLHGHNGVFQIKQYASLYQRNSLKMH